MKKTMRQHGNISGFTLIESAIAILVLALILTPFIYIYNNHITKQRVEETYNNVQNVVNRLQDFRNDNGFYPCPSPMKAERDDPTYGQPHPTACDGASGTPSLATSSCNTGEGICARTSVRAADLANPRVIVGTVPFRALQIDETRAYDAYGSRLVYVVTESMTDIGTIDDSSGAISIINESEESLTDTNGNAGFLVFSHGQNQRGAYSFDGVLIERCGGVGLGPMGGPPVVVAGAGEPRNCHTGFESGTAGGPAVYVSRFMSQDFDDALAYFSDKTIPLWQRYAGDIENIRDLSPENVGIGRLDALDTLDIARSSLGSPDSLHVRGGFSTGTNPEGLNGEIIMAPGAQICNFDDDDDPSNDVCFSIEKFYDGTSYICPTGMYAIGIKGERLECKAEIGVKCTPEEPVLYGIDPDTGEPLCKEMPKDPCPRTTVNDNFTCDNNLVLPPANHGAIEYVAASTGYTDHVGTSAFDIMGDCAIVEYKCNDGEWQMTGTSGGGIPEPPTDRCGVDIPEDPLPGEGVCGYDCEFGSGTYCLRAMYICDPADVHDPTGQYWAIVGMEGEIVDGDCECEPVEPPIEVVREEACYEKYNNPVGLDRGRGAYFAEPVGPDYLITTPEYGTAGYFKDLKDHSSASWPECAPDERTEDTCECIAPSEEDRRPHAGGKELVFDGDPLTRQETAECNEGTGVPSGTPSDYFRVGSNPYGIPTDGSTTKGIVKTFPWMPAINWCQWDWRSSNTENFCECRTGATPPQEGPVVCTDSCQKPVPGSVTHYIDVLDGGAYPACDTGSRRVTACEAEFDSLLPTGANPDDYTCGACQPKTYRWVATSSGSPATGDIRDLPLISSRCDCTDGSGEPRGLCKNAAGTETYNCECTDS